VVICIPTASIPKIYYLFHYVVSILSSINITIKLYLLYLLYFFSLLMLFKTCVFEAFKKMTSVLPLIIEFVNI